MPKIKRRNVPKPLFDHLLLRVKERTISAGDLAMFAAWVYSDPTVPEGSWFKRFSTFVICGDGELVKTILTSAQTAIGKEVE